jgi:hypothetical protein
VKSVMTAFGASLLGAFVLACHGSDERPRDSASGARPPTAALDCGIPAAPALGVLTANGVGDLRVGATVTDVRSRCEIVKDTTLPGPEGTQERRLTLAMGSDSVQAIVDADRIWRVELTSPRFRTTDSLGVATRGWELKRGRGKIATGEGNVAALRDDHCGLSFLLSGVTPIETWRSLPDSSVVRRVLAYGCPTRPNP